MRGINSISKEILAYNAAQTAADQPICEVLAAVISTHLPEVEDKIWHAHPVWFIDGNPIVGYSRQKPGIRLMFWSGMGFDEPELNIYGKKFKDASIFFNDVADIDGLVLRRWLEKSKSIQWDYRNVMRRKGRLERLK